MVELARLLAIDELETGQGVNQIRSLKRPGDTRWGSHLGSISSLIDMFNPASSVLKKLAADSSPGTYRADGDTSFNYLTSPSTYSLPPEINPSLWSHIPTKLFTSLKDLIKVTSTKPRHNTRSRILRQSQLLYLNSFFGSP